jgi:hypothetical protein
MLDPMLLKIYYGMYWSHPAEFVCNVNSNTNALQRLTVIGSHREA